MAWNYLALLAKLLWTHSQPVDRDLAIDDFVARVQRSLMTEPYGRDLRNLKRFALRHHNSEFARVFLAKEKLFEQQQREFRPPGPLGAKMFLLEKTLGRLLSSPALVPSSLLSVVIAVAAVVVMIVLPIANPNGEQADLIDPYAVRVQDSPAKEEEKLFDDWIHGQVLAAMQSTAVREELKKIVQGQERKRNVSMEGSESLSLVIASVLPTLLTEVSLTDDKRDELLRLLTDGRFAQALTTHAARRMENESSRPPTDAAGGDQEGPQQ